MSRGRRPDGPSTRRLLQYQFEDRLQAVLFVDVGADRAEAHLGGEGQGRPVGRGDGEDEAAYPLLAGGPAHEALDGLEGEAPAAELRQDRVAHLGSAILRRAVEADVAAHG